MIINVVAGWDAPWSAYVKINKEADVNAPGRFAGSPREEEFVTKFLEEISKLPT